MDNNRGLQLPGRTALVHPLRDQWKSHTRLASTNQGQPGGDFVSRARRRGCSPASQPWRTRAPPCPSSLPRPPSSFTLSEPFCRRVRTFCSSLRGTSILPSQRSGAEKDYNSFSWLRTHLEASKKFEINSNHEGNRAHPGRSVWQPDRCQGKHFKLIFKLCFI